ncbi:MAG TPA: hypothetical protein VMH87_07065 [Pseudomonadales bacterium]|nr:hypothetical protein [Pseudomonadales bacterium]
MRSKWADFLFTLAVRFIGGGILGTLAGFLICFPGRGAGKNQILIWVTGDENHPHRLVYWILAWAIGGGIIGMFTIPYWQRPWYKYERMTFDKPDKKDDAA